MAYEPAGVFFDVLIVRVDDPPGVILVVLKVAVAPSGRPEADKSTVDLNPAIELMVTMCVATSPCSISLDVGATMIVKSSSGAASTSRIRLAVLVTPPPDTVRERVYDPWAVVLVVPTSSVDWKVGFDDGGLKKCVAPDGSPTRLRLTG